MSSQVWVKKQSQFCIRLKQTVYLLEERVYPGSLIPEVGETYQVRAQKCSAGVECNLLGLRCRWSGLNPTYDPFYDVELMES